MYSNPEAENVIKVCEKSLKDREAERRGARAGGKVLKESLEGK